MIRCPLCMARVRAMVATYTTAPRWRTPPRVDRIVARATHDTQAGLADHMVETHGWVHRSERRAAP